MKIEIMAVQLILFLFLQSCEKKADKISESKSIHNEILNSSDTAVAEKSEKEQGVEIIETDKENENDVKETIVHFPKAGNKSADFLPASGNYKIQYKAEGDLNKDGLDDLVIVLADKKVKTAERPMLIALQNKDQSYRLDQLSKVAFPIEYNEYDYKHYGTEDININKGVLQINLYSIGPGGNIFAAFKYIGKDFILIYAEGDFRGAGGSSSVIYDLAKGKIIETETNTMKEEMPTTTTSTKIKNKNHSFETTSIIDFFQNVQ